MIEQNANERFCHNCGVPNPESHSFCLRCGVRINFLRPLPAIADRLPGRYPIRYDVEYPERLSRLLIFVKWWLLVIPHLLITYALSTVSGVIAFIAWFAILFTRRYPKGLFDVVVGFNRWGANVTSYMALLRDEYPPFATDPGRYPVRYEIDYPEKLNRWLILIKWLLVIPHYIVLYILFFIAVLVWFIGWFAILFTGRFPRGMFDFLVGVMRWNYRVTGYTSLLRDEFPPYSMAAEAGPGSRTSVILSAIAGFVLVPVVVGGFIALSTIDVSETHEVPVRYSDALAQRSTFPVDIEGTEVILLRAEDSVNLGQTRIPRTGHRYVRFQLEITDIDSPFTSVARRTFVLQDSRGREHDPVVVQGVPGEYILSGGETVTVGVVFEIPQGDQPSSLTYSPGFAAFVPFGERVRFEFTGTEARALSPRASSPSPTASPRTYEITVSVDFGTAVPFSVPVEVGGLRFDPVEVEDPHPSRGRAPLTNRPPVDGTRYIAFYLPITNVDATTVIITADDFHLSDTLVGGGLTPDFLTSGGYPLDESTLEPRFSTLVGLVFEVDTRAHPVGLTYFPQFAAPFVASNHNVHFEFR